jgi:hypothetical protein
MVRWIDSLGGWRYSQAQIPDLVANAIPRFRLRAESFGLALVHVRWVSKKLIESMVRRPAGAKAQTNFAGFARGVKPPSPSGSRPRAGAKAHACFVVLAAQPKTTFGSSVVPTGLIDFHHAFPGLRSACPGLFSTAPSGSDLPGGSAGFSSPWVSRRLMGPRLKSCPDTRRGEQGISISTACIAVPVSAASSRSRFESTSQRSTGGRRFL